ncbi:uncharacterized protein MELLADRAFT_108930 [Melampsora larici-populina 98AG31]|uniref:Uncharacterized protein n=1 Tax=Melampsora larici-populina (strain 98AG31 / pathotype 3-4-7) TaxID=747676 RepID=F4RUS4_MELLP|nr:uncharacterized protein MELLADRAFT_108930 [Melampsora larici-populina 98AG31]EGG03744.1 hypothetical protein MELLADRAFT_108930 [Melampsora larici-populina 98AG31]
MYTSFLASDSGKVIGEATSYEANLEYNVYESYWETVHQVPLHDLRKMTDRPTLNEYGFTYVSGRDVKSIKRLGDFSGDQKKALTKDSVKIVEELINPTLAISYSSQFRNPMMKYLGEPNPNLHSDLSPEGAQKTISWVEKRFLESEDPEEKAFGQLLSTKAYNVVILNVWRPLSKVEADPLGLCRWTSVAPSDRVDSKIVPDRAGNALQAWNYGDHQEWFYLKEQEPHEAHVFIQHDGRANDGHGMSVPHASFVLRENEDKPKRKSFECRVMALFPKK